MTTTFPVVMTPSEKIARTAPAVMTSAKMDMTVPVVTFAIQLCYFHCFFDVYKSYSFHGIIPATCAKGIPWYSHWTLFGLSELGLIN